MVLEHDDVRGLDVAVDDAVVVDIVEAPRNVVADLRDVMGRQQPLGDPISKVCALDELHDQIELRPLRVLHIGAGVEQGDQVVMVQACVDPDLILVAAQIAGIHSWCRDELDGDVAAQKLIPGTVNGSHRTAPDLLAEAIPAAD